MTLTLADYSTKEKVQWCPGCVLPNTLIHTGNSDIIEIKDLRVGDKVLGSDGSYHKITEVMSHHHKGKMYKLTVKQFGTCDLTHEHPVYIARRMKNGAHNTDFTLVWVPAEELKIGDYVAYPIPKTTIDMKTIELKYEKRAMDRKGLSLPRHVDVDAKFMRLVGYYLAEGHVHTREIRFTFNIKEKSYADDVQDIIKDVFGLTSTVRIRRQKHTLEVFVSSALLARLFEKWFGTGAQKKKIPHFMMLLPIRKQAELLKGLWRGDGCVSMSKACYKTISPVLCHQIKLLLLRCGIVPVIHKEKSKGMHKEAYGMFVIDPEGYNRLMKLFDSIYSKKSNNRQLIVQDKNYVYLPIRKIDVYRYDGIVHNLEVEGVHSYVTQNATLHNCGNFAMAGAIRSALFELGIPPHQVLISSGVGCSGKMPHYVGCYGFEGLHGRSLPVASGAKLANHKLTVLAVGGDGDGYGIGSAHFLHIMRRNYDITYIVHDNQIYGLTTGQASPTTQLGVKTKTTPFGVVETPFNPIATAITSGATFVARVFAGDMAHMKEVMKEAIVHRGFALVDVLQPCVTFNKLNTYEYFMKRCYKLQDPKTQNTQSETQNKPHDTSDVMAALVKAFEVPSTNYEKIPIGIFYKETRSTYEDSLPQIKEKALVEQPLSKPDFSKIYEEMM